MSARRMSLSDQVRRAIDAAAATRYQIAKAAGVDHAVMSRFMANKVGLSTKTLDALAAVLDLRVRAGGPVRVVPPAKRGPKPKSHGAKITKRQLTRWENPKRIPRILRRDTAYHEAGHAAIYFFAGCFGDLGFIDMRPDKANWARVHPDHAGFQSAPHWRAMLSLAGPYAQNRVEDKAEDWLEWALEDAGMEWNDCFAPPEDDNQDVANAVRAARMCYPKSWRRVRQFVLRMGRWTDECFNEPGMWRVVEALAEVLCHKDHLERDQAWEIMERAYGAEWPPCLCPRWRRRNRVMLTRMLRHQ